MPTGHHVRPVGFWSGRGGNASWLENSTRRSAAPTRVQCQPANDRCFRRRRVAPRDSAATDARSAGRVQVRSGKRLASSRPQTAARVTNAWRSDCSRRARGSARALCVRHALFEARFESAIRFRPHDRNCERDRSDAFQETFEVVSKHPNTTRADPARTDIGAVFFAQFGAFRLVRRQKTEQKAGRRERRKPAREGARRTASAHCARSAERRALRSRAHETPFFAMFFAHASLVCRIEALIRTCPTCLRRRFVARRHAPTRRK